MPTIKYGDVVTADSTLEGTDLEETLRKRRLAAKEKLQNSEAATEDQQADNNTKNESK